ncbi:MAG TPA: WecB/TagA/CpsF family glycosyltransferase [Phycisphaerae bacterium]|nr:WecB/TagA/CpsF family glycosyltransferase [Phycisphaerae bacterium]
MISAFLILAIAPLAFCWALWLLFALLALLPSHASTHSTKPARVITIDILIPAHNEELLLPRLLESIGAQTLMAPIGRILVVADHCSDSTADIARTWAGGGAEVLERHSGPRGKPAALRDGLAWLKARTHLQPTERAVLILDADCTISPNLVETIHHVMAAGTPVVQASYLLDGSSDRSPRLHLPARIAFALKNVIRPRGMLRLGIPTQLFGTGMCFRADLLDTLTFDDHLTEDLAISHDLLLAGMPPTLVPDAVVHSPLPTERSAMTTQKLRWETGQVQTWSKLPSMLALLLARGRFRNAAALLDWSAPPVAMAVMYWMAITLLFLWCAMVRWTSPWLLLVPLATIGFLATYVLAGAAQVAGPRGVAALAIGVPRFFLWKTALYARMLTGHAATAWIRTPRPSLPTQPLGASESFDILQIENQKSKIENSPETSFLTSRLLGMPLNAMTESQTVHFVADRIARRQGTWVLTPNLDILRQYCTAPEVRSFFHADEGGADLLVADGMPLVWASRLAGRPVPERVPGSGLVLRLAEVAAGNKWSIYLLGGSPGAADRASAILQARYPGLEIAGACCPLPGFEKDPGQLAAIREKIRAADPQIVYVALGFPKQETIIRYLRPALPAATFIGVGISLSFIAGEIRRAPRLVQQLGLEWAHRLVQEPRRLARRYLVDDLPFALFRLFPQSFAARWDRDFEKPDHNLADTRLRRSSRINPVEGSEGRTYEGRHPRGRSGHSPQSPDQGHQQAPPPRLRQTHDHVPH